jgi:RNA polymerase sigma-70 factor (ECF subfamily)
MSAAGVRRVGIVPEEAEAAEEAALVAAAKADPRAFAPLYRRHVGPVYRFCLRRLGDREAAEDAAAEVFARALAGLGGFRGGSFRGWLFAIAHRAVVDHARAARPRAPLAAAADVADPAPGPEEAAVAAEAAGAVRAVLAQLPRGQRRVVELRLAGLSGVEIAAALGRSHGSVRAQQHRALVRLRRLLGVAPTGAGEGTDG